MRSLAISATATIIASLAAVQGHAEWRVINFVDEFGDPTGDKGVVSVGVFPTTNSCQFTIEEAIFSSVKCGYFNLVGGDYESGTRTWMIRIKVGGVASTVQMYRLSDGSGGYFREEATQTILEAAKDPNDNLMIALPYFKAGNVMLKFPLAGLAQSLSDVGISVPQQFRVKVVREDGIAIETTNIRAGSLEEARRWADKKYGRVTDHEIDGGPTRNMAVESSSRPLLSNACPVV